MGQRISAQTVCLAMMLCADHGACRIYPLTSLQEHACQCVALPAAAP